MRLKVQNIAKIFLDEVPNRLKLQCGVQKRATVSNQSAKLHTKQQSSMVTAVGILHENTLE